MIAELFWTFVSSVGRRASTFADRQLARHEPYSFLFELRELTPKNPIAPTLRKRA